MTVGKQLIEDIKELRKSIETISVYNISTYSMLELYYKLAGKINELIKEMERFEVDISEEIIEQNKKLIYLLNEGLKIEVCKKIEEMVINGTLDKIINHSLFNTLNKKIDDITDNKTNFILYSFFRNSSSAGIDLYVSQDGDTLERINVNTIFDGKDPSIYYNNGWWYIAVTSYDPHDFVIYKSNDLVNWENYKIDLGLYNVILSPKIWAPEFFEDDNGKVYITLSKMTGETTDINGETIPSFRTYITECTDLETLSFSEPILINLDNSNKIDPVIFKDNNIYNLFVKDDYDKYIEHWTSTDLANWVYKRDITELGQYVEGATITKHNNKFYLYADAYKGDMGLIYYTYSDNLVNWSPRRNVKIGTNRARHGTALLIKDNKAKLDIEKFILSNKSIPKHNMRSKGMTLNQFADSNGVIKNLELIDGVVYSITNNEHFTIESFNNSNRAKHFYLYLATNESGSITINCNGEVVGVPNGYTIKAETGDNDTLLEFIYAEPMDKFKPTTTSNSNFIEKNEIKKGGWKTITLTSQTIDRLNVEDGVIYRVNGGQNVIINGIESNKAPGTHFYLMLAAGGSGSITVNSGNDISVPNGVLNITSAENLNDCLIEFIKVQGSNFRLVK